MIITLCIGFFVLAAVSIFILAVLVLIADSLLRIELLLEGKDHDIEPMEILPSLKSMVFGEKEA